MVLVKQIIEDAEYDYIANLYPGMSAHDYLSRQLGIWLTNEHEEFNVELGRELYIVVARKEVIPKSLRERINIIDHRDDVAKSLHIQCVSLQSPSPEPDETKTITLWYDVIELGSKRAERSLIRILDKYMYKDIDPYKDKPAKPASPVKKRTKPTNKGHANLQSK